MTRYLLRRTLHSLLSLFGASVIVFLMLRFLPGDPAALLLPEGAPQDAVDQINRALGLKEPLHVQYGLFLLSVARGEFGESFQYKTPALKVFMERFPATIRLGLVSMSLVLLVAIPISILAAVRQGSPLDHGAMFVAVLGQAMPSFWLGIMLILFFGVGLRWFPTSGDEGPRSIVLPAITLAGYPIALVARLMRSNLLEVLGKDYIRTASSKGLREGVIVMRHALKNAALPVVTVIGLLFGHLLSGAVITESVFAWPGIGKLIVDAIFWRDYPIVQTVLIISATVFIIINLLIDVLCFFLDPRIRYG